MEKVETILDAHSKNSLEGHQFKIAKDFLNRAEFSVPLDKLYKVLASCNFNENNFYCPVLLQVVNSKIKEHAPDKDYLLQVWTKEGEMVFERALKYPVFNWNVTHDKLMFQEEPEENEGSGIPTLWVVKLFKDKTPFIFKFKFPAGFKNDVVRTKFDKFQNKLVVPPSHKHDPQHDRDLEESNNSILDLSYMEERKLESRKSTKSEDY